MILHYSPHLKMSLHYLTDCRELIHLVIIILLPQNWMTLKTVGYFLDKLYLGDCYSNLCLYTIKSSDAICHIVYHTVQYSAHVSANC